MQLDEYNKSISKVIETIRKNSEYIRKSLESFNIYMDNFRKQIKYIVTPLQQFASQIAKLQNDPDSLLNYFDYMKDLSKYYWAMPYDIKTEELKEIFENVSSEKEFDDYMKKYFTKNKLNRMFNDIRKKLPKKHIVIFKQIENSFYYKHYSLINNAIISIIDDELSYYNKNKKDTSRKNLLAPIIEEYKKTDFRDYNWISLFYLMMLNNNVNILFDNVDFNKIYINNNKDIRRHASQHGKKYSNKKIVSIMLFNTLYNLLYIKEDFYKYKGKIKYSNKDKKYIL